VRLRRRHFCPCVHPVGAPPSRARKTWPGLHTTKYIATNPLNPESGATARATRQRAARKKCVALASPHNGPVSKAGWPSTSDASA